MPVSARSQPLSQNPARTLESLQFMNHLARLPEHFFSRINPMGFDDATLVHVNPAALALLDLDKAQAQRKEFAEYFSGKKLLPGAESLATVYAGHQFGHYVPELGDGRAHLLGEVVNGCGEKWDVQLKGSGRTPYSRFGDGRAVLRSTIREYLCSEAMHGLGIPTTRALCIVGSSEEVMREEVETAAILTRLAPSHLRFGHFEYFFYTGQQAEVKKLADFLLEEHFPEFGVVEEKYSLLFEEIVTRTARLIAQWMAVGFAHGVMNTDNMSILGLTLDYGPFGFMEAFNPQFSPNHSDDQERYAFDQQPSIAFWNLHALGQALSPIVPIVESAMILQLFEPTLMDCYSALMRAKLGLAKEQADDMVLLQNLLDLLEEGGVDYTLCFRRLGNVTPRGKNNEFLTLFNDQEGATAWLKSYFERLKSETLASGMRQRRMMAVNPRYILRNYLAEKAIALAKQGDFSEIDRLLTLLQNPYTDQPKYEGYDLPAPPEAGEIVVSCSS